MVKSIRFLKAWRCFKKDDWMAFKPGINLLTGDQGCGKSSLLIMLKNDGYFGREKIAEIEAPQGTVSYYLDFERGLARDKDANELSELGVKLGDAVMQRFLSHGQSILAHLYSMPKTKDSVLILDEPDTALSMKSIKILYEQLENCAKLNQVILSSHNPYLMELVGEVYSVEHQSYMQAAEFKRRITGE